MKFGSRLEKFASILVLFSTGILVSGTKACQEDYDFASQSNVPATGTAVTTGTTTGTPSPTGSPTVTVVATGTLTVAGTLTPTGAKTAVATATSSESVQDFGAQGSLFSDLSALGEGKAARTGSDTGTTGAGGSQSDSKGQNWLGAAFQKDGEGAWKDSDGDGFSDTVEEEAGADPHDSAATPKLAPATRLDERVRPQDVELEADRRGDETRAGEGDQAEVDTDGDGIPDEAEAQRGTNPGAIDSDQDGIRDDREIVLGTNPLKVDSDGDGVSDSREYSNGTDPTIPEPKPQGA